MRVTISLILRNLFFTLLQPGIVAGLVPYWLLGARAKSTFDEPFSIWHYAGTAIFAAGMAIMLTCIGSFAFFGAGTLSPADPTQKLVIKGLYRFSRNPMYVGVLQVLIGEAVFFQSGVLWAYTALIFTAFHTYVVYFEEPRLRRDFGEEYQAYQKRVNRWF